MKPQSGIKIGIIPFIGIAIMLAILIILLPMGVLLYSSTANGDA